MQIPFCQGSTNWLSSDPALPGATTAVAVAAASTLWTTLSVRIKTLPTLGVIGCWWTFRFHIKPLWADQSDFSLNQTFQSS
jgi:hypothetical protein